MTCCPDTYTSVQSSLLAHHAALVQTLTTPFTLARHAIPTQAQFDFKTGGKASAKLLARSPDTAPSSGSAELRAPRSVSPGKPARLGAGRSARSPESPGAMYRNTRILTPVARDGEDDLSPKFKWKQTSQPPGLCACVRACVCC
jgi:hypothetical protein